MCFQVCIHEQRHHSSATTHSAAITRHDIGQSNGNPEVLVASHLRGVSTWMTVKMSGSGLLAKRRHCANLQSRFTRDQRAEPLLHFGWHMCLARRFTEGSSPSGCWLVNNGHGHDVIMNVSAFSGCGYRELHRLASSPPRWWI